MQTDGLICVLHAKNRKCSSDRRLTRETSFDNPICWYGTPFFKPNPPICIEKKAPEAGLEALCDQTRKPAGHW